MKKSFFTETFRAHKTNSDSVRVYEENRNRRPDSIRAAKDALIRHYVGLETVLRVGGYDKAADVIRFSLPDKKRVRSGDLGEILAVEFLDSETRYKVPISKLRYKSDRNTPMHGDDVIAISKDHSTPRILKCECKSRSRFYASHLKDAIEQLDNHGGLPNPATLSFITKRLYEQREDELASIFRDLQSTQKLMLHDVEHLLFVFSGNNPAAVLSTRPEPAAKVFRWWCACVIVSEHSNFISSVFELAHGKQP